MVGLAVGAARPAAVTELPELAPAGLREGMFSADRPGSTSGWATSLELPSSCGGASFLDARLAPARLPGDGFEPAPTTGDGPDSAAAVVAAEVERRPTL